MRLLRWGIKRLPLRGCIIRVETRQPNIALTFDDGPDLRFTPPLLDLLRRHDAKGTFYQLIKLYRELLSGTVPRRGALRRRIGARG